MTVVHCNRIAEGCNDRRPGAPAGVWCAAAPCGRSLRTVIDFCRLATSLQKLGLQKRHRASEVSRIGSLLSRLCPRGVLRRRLTKVGLISRASLRWPPHSTRVVRSLSHPQMPADIAQLDQVAIIFDSSQALGVTVGKTADGHTAVTHAEPTSTAASLAKPAKILAVNQVPCAGKSKSEVLEAIKTAKTAAPQFTLTFETSSSFVEKAQPEASMTKSPVKMPDAVDIKAPAGKEYFCGSCCFCCIGSYLETCYIPANLPDCIAGRSKGHYCCVAGESIDCLMPGHPMFEGMVIKGGMYEPLFVFCTSKQAIVRPRFLDGGQPICKGVYKGGCCAGCCGSRLAWPFDRDEVPCLCHCPPFCGLSCCTLCPFGGGPTCFKELPVCRSLGSNRSPAHGRVVVRVAYPCRLSRDPADLGGEHAPGRRATSTDHSQ